MQHRAWSATCVAVAIGWFCLAPPRVAGQGRGAASRPDLEGIWSFASLTPLERPGQFAGKDVLSDEEAAEFEKQALDRNNADRRTPGTDADVALAYNNFWYDRGTKVVGTKRTSLVIDPPDGRIPALTTEGAARAAARAEARRQHGPSDGPEDRSLSERCLLFNAGPPMLPGPYNNNVQIVQSRDYVVVSNAMSHAARVVPPDGRPHLPRHIRRWQGDARGRWEGNTLVVDTTNFSDRTNVRGSDENLHLIERFTRVGADMLMYQFTIDDPTAFTRPWTVAIPMTRTDDQIYEYACHEGNYAMGGMLRGARAQEK